jgi:hypothetical protein
MSYANKRLVSFGDYTFPDTEQQIDDNFLELEKATVKLPGADGVFDEYGVDPSPAVEGRVTMTFILEVEDPADMTAALDSLRALRRQGVKALRMQPTDSALDSRWCWARLSRITAPEDKGSTSELWRRVTIQWLISDPKWNAGGNEAPLYDSGVLYDDGSLYDGEAGFAASGTQTNQTITLSGNAIVQPRITVACGVGQSVSTVTVQRIVSGLVVDEVEWLGSLTAGETLEINCRAYSVEVDGVDAYADGFDFLDESWFRLVPGTNSIRVIFGNSANEATVTVAYYEGYY